MANSFFKNGDKAYSENLNDGILVGNAFDWTVEVSLPSDTGSVFPNSSTIVMAKVADVSITPNSNLSIGSSIENSSGSSQVYRLTVYPNFNRFGGFKSIALEGDGTFYIANKGANTPIANNLDYDDLSNVPELKVLKEYDIVVTIPNGGEVNGLSFIFQSSSADVSGTIDQSNVTGLDDRLDNIEGTVNDLFDLVYPVGSIYMSVNSTSPSVLFGGTWERIEERFLLGATTQSEVGDTGGSATVTLTANQSGLKAHTHGMAHTHNHRHDLGEDWSKGSGSSTAYTKTSSRSTFTAYSSYDNTSSSKTNTDSNSSSSASEPHENMPPYIVVNIWERTA